MNQKLLTMFSADKSFNYLSKLATIVLIISLCQNTFGQQWEPVTDKVTSNIVKDSSGNLWMGVFGGLGKFNGTDWTLFHAANSTIPTNHISKIASDTSGNIWFSDYKHLYMFDQNTFHNFDSLNISLSFNAIYCIYADSKGNLWVGTDVGLVHFNSATWSKQTWQDSLPSNYVYELAEDLQGNLIGGFHFGIVGRYDGQHWEKYHPPYYLKYEGPYIFSLSVDSLNRIWAGSDYDIFIYEDTTIHLYQIPDIYRANSIVFIDSVIWISSPHAIVSISNGNILRYSASEGNLPFIEPKGLCLNNNILYAISDVGLFSFQNNNWIQHRYSQSCLNSANYFPLKNKNNGELYVGYTTIDSTPLFNVHSISDLWNCSAVSLSFQNNANGYGIRDFAVDTAGNIFVFESGGVHVYNGQQWTHHSSQQLTGNSNVHGAFLNDQKGNMWFMSNAGAIRFNENNWSGPISQPFIGHNAILDADYNLYYTSINKILKYDGINEELIDSVNVPLYQPPGVISLDMDNNLWLGGTIIHKREGNIIKSFALNHPQSSFNKAEAIAVDLDNIVWVAVRGEGIYRIENDSITIYNSNNSGLPNNNVSNILIDNNGVKFINIYGYNSGIVKFSDGGAPGYYIEPVAEPFPILITSASSQEFSNNLLIYPNPVRENLVVLNLNDKKLNSISLFNFSGQELFRQTKSVNDYYNVDMSKFESGIYILKVVSDSDTAYKRIMKY